MRLTIGAALAVAFALALGTGTAGHCTTYSTSEPELTFEALGRAWYVDNDLCQLHCLFSVWIYDETNGIDGLQRGDEVVDDTCHGMIESDGGGLW